jgi:hypothetical protein
MEEIQSADEGKFDGEMESAELKQGVLLLSEKVNVAKKRVDRLGITEGGWNQAIGDLSMAMNKLGESSQAREVKMGESGETHTYLLRFLSPEKGLYSFCRAGDARESCIATNGVNNWTIPGYIMNEGTRAFVVIDATDNRAVGHSITHIYESAETVGVISNGIYLDGSVPLGVADGLAEYMDDWSQSSGFGDLKIALSGYSDVVPDGWGRETIGLRVLQGVKVNERDLYYDGMLQASQISATEVLGRVLPDAMNLIP